MAPETASLGRLTHCAPTIYVCISLLSLFSCSGDQWGVCTASPTAMGHRTSKDPRSQTALNCKSESYVLGKGVCFSDHRVPSSLAGDLACALLAAGCISALPGAPRFIQRHLILERTSSSLVVATTTAGPAHWALGVIQAS